MQQAYKDSRESGRHFDLHPWHKVPIPRYDIRNPLHKEISALCREAEKSAERTVDQELKARPNKGQIGLSKAVRKGLAKAGVDAAINEAPRCLNGQRIGKTMKLRRLVT